MSKGEILLDRAIIQSRFCVLEYTFHRFLSPNFCRIGYHLKAKILEAGRKIFFVGTSPYKFRSGTPLGF